MAVSNIIVGVCCALAFGAMVWAVINEFKPESKDKAVKKSENTENKENKDGDE